MNIPRYAALSLMICIVAFMGLKSPEANAYPQPALVPPGYELNFYYDQPQIIYFKGKGDLEAKRYLYIPYRVENRTGKDRFFIPRIDMITDTGIFRRDGQNVGTDVFVAVRDQTRIPMLLNQVRISGNIGYGRDNTKHGAAIFQLPDHDVDSFTVFITGLNNESAIVQNLKTGEDIHLNKSLMLIYDLPGDNQAMTDRRKNIELIEEKWIMR